MQILRRIVRYGWYALNRQRVAQDLREELETHRALMGDPTRFGTPERVEERVADVVGWTQVDALWRDIRFSARTLLRTPSFIIAVLSLGVAIGATVAVYNTADWLLRRSPGGVVAPDELVTLRIVERDRTDLNPRGYGLSFPQYLAMRKTQDVFTDVATYGKLVGVVTTDTRSDQVVVEYVTGSYFGLLGVRPLLGRLLTAEDDLPGIPPNTVLSYLYWQEQFGGDPGVVGRAMQVNGVLTRVVGVLPATFEGYALDWNGPTSIWATTAVSQSLGNGGLTTRANNSFFPVIGRLKRGVSLQDVERTSQGWLETLPPLKMPAWVGNQILVRPTSEFRINSRQAAQDFLGVILVVCILILVAACFNLANVLLGRTFARRQEFGVRAALGAGRSRLLAHIIGEGVCIAAAAGVMGTLVGIAVAWALATLPRVYLNALAATTPVTTFGAIDGQLVWSAFGLGVVAAVLFGCVPLAPLAFRSTVSVMRDAPSTWTWGRLRVSSRQVVLIAQVALAITLATTAGLYGRTFLRAAAVRPPYEQPESILVTRVALTAVPPAARKDVWPALLARLNAEPDVIAATVGWNPPYRVGFTRVQLPGGDPNGVQMSSTAGAPGFFAVQGVPVVEGREFSATGEDERTGFIINRVLAQRLWPGQAAVVGQTVILNGASRTITGVVADDHCSGLLEEPVPCGWQPWTPDSGTSYLRVRTKGAPMAFVPRLRQVLRELAPTGALAEAAPLDVMFDEIIAPQRNAAVIALGLATFGVLLLALGAIALFLSMVRDSRREIAVRLAIGATPAMVVRRVMWQGMALVASGCILGVAIAYMLARQIEEQLFQVGPTDAPSLVAAPLVVSIVSLLAIGYAASDAAKTEIAPQIHAQ